MNSPETTEEPIITEFENAFYPDEAETMPDCVAFPLSPVNADDPFAVAHLKEETTAVASAIENFVAKEAEELKREPLSVAVPVLKIEKGNENNTSPKQVSPENVKREPQPIIFPVIKGSKEGECENLRNETEEPENIDSDSCSVICVEDLQASHECNNVFRILEEGKTSHKQIAKRKSVSYSLPESQEVRRLPSRSCKSGQTYAQYSVDSDSDSDTSSSSATLSGSSDSEESLQSRSRFSKDKNSKAKASSKGTTVICELFGEKNKRPVDSEESLLSRSRFSKAKNSNAKASSQGTTVICELFGEKNKRPVESEKNLQSRSRFSKAKNSNAKASSQGTTVICELFGEKNKRPVESEESLQSRSRFSKAENSNSKAISQGTTVNWKFFGENIKRPVASESLITPPFKTSILKTQFSRGADVVNFFKKKVVGTGEYIGLMPSPSVKNKDIQKSAPVTTAASVRKDSPKSNTATSSNMVDNSFLSDSTIVRSDESFEEFITILPPRLSRLFVPIMRPSSLPPLPSTESTETLQKCNRSSLNLPENTQVASSVQSYDGTAKNTPSLFSLCKSLLSRKMGTKNRDTIFKISFCLRSTPSQVQSLYNMCKQSYMNMIIQKRLKEEMLLRKNSAETLFDSNHMNLQKDRQTNHGNSISLFKKSSSSSSDIEIVYECSNVSQRSEIYHPQEALWGPVFTLKQVFPQAEKFIHPKASAPHVLTNKTETRFKPYNPPKKCGDVTKCSMILTDSQETVAHSEQQTVANGSSLIQSHPQTVNCGTDIQCGSQTIGSGSSVIHSESQTVNCETDIQFEPQTVCSGTNIQSGPHGSDTQTDTHTVSSGSSVSHSVLHTVNNGTDIQSGPQAVGSGSSNIHSEPQTVNSGTDIQSVPRTVNSGTDMQFDSQTVSISVIPPETQIVNCGTDIKSGPQTVGSKISVIHSEPQVLTSKAVAHIKDTRTDIVRNQSMSNCKEVGSPLTTLATPVYSEKEALAVIDGDIGIESEFASATITEESSSSVTVLPESGRDNTSNGRSTTFTESDTSVSTKNHSMNNAVSVIVHNNTVENTTSECEPLLDKNTLTSLMDPKLKDKGIRQRENERCGTRFGNSKSQVNANCSEIMESNENASELEKDLCSQSSLPNENVMPGVAMQDKNVTLMHTESCEQSKKFGYSGKSLNNLPKSPCSSMDSIKTSELSSIKSSILQKILTTESSKSMTTALKKISMPCKPINGKVPLIVLKDIIQSHCSVSKLPDKSLTKLAKDLVVNQVKVTEKPTDFEKLNVNDKPPATEQMLETTTELISEKSSVTESPKRNKEIPKAETSYVVIKNTNLELIRSFLERNKPKISEKHPVEQNKKEFMEAAIKYFQRKKESSNKEQSSNKEKSSNKEPNGTTRKTADTGNKSSQRTSKNGSSAKCPYCPRGIHTLNHVYYCQNYRMGKYQCKVCERKFVNSKRLKEHMISHTGEKPYKCSECAFSCGTYSGLKVHKEAIHMSQSYICEKCGQVFKYYRRLNEHVRYVHNNVGTFKCQHCDMEFLKFSTYDNHRRYGHRSTEDLLECNYCGKKFKKKYSMSVHIKRVHLHMRMKKTCKICHISTTNIGKHMVTHTRERKFPCSLCDKRFMYSYDLKKHMKSSLHKN